MTAPDLARLKEAFAQAALRAQKAGYDGVQLHTSHGMLLSQFLSPYYNRRSDEYGGAIENRAKLLLEILTAVRAKVGRAFPVLAKINCSDFIKGGFSFEDSQYVCQQLAAGGIDALEISGGLTATKDKTTTRISILESGQEAYFAEYVAKIAANLSIPVILIGGLRSLAVMERLLNETEISYFSLCRPLISEPDLIKRWQQGDRAKARCISCNNCRTPEGVKCTVFN